MSKVAIIGYGWVGRAYHKIFPGAVIYDEPQELCVVDVDPTSMNGHLAYGGVVEQAQAQFDLETARNRVNESDIAIICVPTDAKDGQLDTSIVEDVVDWLEPPLILIKSALQPGTVDRLVKKTGKKIAVSVEMVGEGKYFVPYWKYPHAENPAYHDFLIVGGEEETARRCADILWEKMSPDISIHLVSAVEAEVCKLMENSWGAMKVTFANALYDICEKLGANYTKVLQAWGADGRVEKMHMRVLPHKRGWGGKCYSKDVPALAALDDSGLLRAVVEANKKHASSSVV